MYLEKRGKKLWWVRIMKGGFETERRWRVREIDLTSLCCNRIFQLAFPLMGLSSLSLLASSSQPRHREGTRD